MAEAVWKLTAESVAQPSFQPIGGLPDNDWDVDQARSASIKGPVPMIFITRFRLYART